MLIFCKFIWKQESTAETLKHNSTQHLPRQILENVGKDFSILNDTKSLSKSSILSEMQLNILQEVV